MNPLLQDIPTTIKTQRLLIRAYQPGDGAAINAAALESHEDLKVWLPWAQTIGTVEDTEIFIRHCMSNWILRKRLDMGIFDATGTSFIGHTGFHDIDWQVGNLQITYWIRSSCSGKGYVTESTKALTRFAFEHLGMKRVEIRCDTQNVKSRAVAQRLGFEQEAILKKSVISADGTELRDVVVYVRFDDNELSK